MLILCSAADELLDWQQAVQKILLVGLLPVNSVTLWLQAYLVQYHDICGILRPGIGRLYRVALLTDAFSLQSPVVFHEVHVAVYMQAFEFLFTCQMSSTQKDGAFVNNEFDDVYLVRCSERHHSLQVCCNACC
jgi:hypothetical protein